MNWRQRLEAALERYREYKEASEANESGEPAQPPNFFTAEDLELASKWNTSPLGELWLNKFGETLNEAIIPVIRRRLGLGMDRYDEIKKLCELDADIYGAIWRNQPERAMELYQQELELWNKLTGGEESGG